MSIDSIVLLRAKPPRRLIVGGNLSQPGERHLDPTATHHRSAPVSPRRRRLGEAGEEKLKPAPRHLRQRKLPLGGNAVKKALGRQVIEEVSVILHDSIKYGLDHRAAGVEHALPLGRGLDRALADKFIGMYVNELTIDYGDRGRKGVREFLDRAHTAGLIPEPVALEFV